jgi:hypothetical protein
MRRQLSKTVVEDGRLGVPPYRRDEPSEDAGNGCEVGCLLKRNRIRLPLALVLQHAKQLLLPFGESSPPDLRLDIRRNEDHIVHLPAKPEFSPRPFGEILPWARSCRWLARLDVEVHRAHLAL